MACQGKSIIISGGARGIGRCLARTMLQKGHRVYILDIDQTELDHTVQKHLQPYSTPKTLSSAICNLRDVQDIRRTVKEAAAFFDGKIDCLINNGGIAHPYWKDGKSMDDPETIEQWQAYVDTNLTAPFAVTQACVPFMKAESADEAVKLATTSDTDEAGPCIIHIGSFRAQQSDENQEGYASTKAGLIGLMHSMAVSFKPWGIRCNMIMPGRIKVDHECKEGDDAGKTWESGLGGDDVDVHVTNRPGRAEDIANAADYLMNAGFVTGQSITVDGGSVRVKNKA